MPTLDPLSLKLFVAVAETGTIAAAAEREHIAAAALSKRMSEIEATLGVALLTRTNKGVAPTEAGQRLVSLAQHALHQLDDIVVQMRDYASGTRGLIRMAANISSVVQFLPGDIQRFAAQHPQISILIEEKPSAGVLRAVAENAVDIGVFTSVPHGFALETFPYHRDRLVLVCPAGHALAKRASMRLAEALAHEFVNLPPDTAISQQVTQAAHGLAQPLRVRIQVTSYDAQALMIGAGLGVGVMPEAVARHQAVAQALGVVMLDEAWAERDLLIAVRSSQALTAACRMLVEHLRAA
ncbi:FIG000557: hypothetical protein co-occurring with RecR [Caballeronia glathei]|jgi:DNA-binding transcriptional LysR family regulator|uniref:LysR family transcriptional regulator n=1 Tax=Caballeronia glathei TaxID=60547 RepID=A0A069PM13_9BURK|nr:LysR family transcriptional regulator [Caballeronia glathei]KDR40964.1 LysR family transcriptional regulator [Caballeronia glathei]CDY73611.1 FIG000557: hypothetical protein co-occurring with RecR [Caballeronia glathei]